MTPLLFAVCVAIATSRQVPTTIVASMHDSAAALTAIVVADIDRDGDADVVAMDEALQLFVWINDGTGRLVRQRPAPAHNRAGDASRPGVDGGANRSVPSAPTDPPAFDARGSAWSAQPLIASGVARRASDPHRDRARSARRLRGPPPASPLI